MKNEENKKGKKKNAYLLLLLVLLLGVTVGFATLSATLTIHGTSTINSSTDWDIGPDPTAGDEDGIDCPSGQVCTINPQDDPTNPVNPDDISPDDGTTKNPENCTDPQDPSTCTGPYGAIIWMDGNTVYFKHLLSVPGETFTFNVTYKNNGTIPAKVSNVSKTTLTGDAATFLTYDVTYANGDPVAIGDTLAAGASVVYKVTVSYNSVTALPTTAQLANINTTNGGHPTEFSVTFEQA